MMFDMKSCVKIDKLSCYFWAKNVLLEETFDNVHVKWLMRCILSEAFGS